MRKIILLCVLAIGMMADAQTVQTIAKPLKLNIVAAGTAADKHLVIGSDKVVKQVSDNSVKTVNGIEPVNGDVTLSVSPQVNSDWNATSGSGLILNKPSFRTINGQSIFGSTDLTISSGISIPHLESNNGDKTVWNNGKKDIESNTVYGEGTLRLNTTGINNTATGKNALYSNTTGDGNTANGKTSLYSNTEGGANTANGLDALHLNTTGNNNIGNGYAALYYNTTGSENVAIGGNAGSALGNHNMNTITNNSVFLGYYSRALANNQTNQIVIGHTAVGAGSNTVTIGNTSIVRTVISGVIQKRALDTAPTSATAPGTVGEIRFTATHVYWCIAPNTWIRAAGSTW
ncbi:hypothetical protein [Flavobacterium polysaccharolyticum]|uniref:Uncharacterized protein n=1 Tax=Flavobacterium polysaccharolyticum TaxID=3133148 RepID=A0ABU9NIK5_9FLAO